MRPCRAETAFQPKDGQTSLGRKYQPASAASRRRGIYSSRERGLAVADQQEIDFRLSVAQLASVRFGQPLRLNRARPGFVPIGADVVMPSMAGIPLETRGSGQ